MMEKEQPIPLENLKETLREKHILAANAILALARNEISATDASAIAEDLNSFIRKVDLAISSKSAK
jgi:hypothetical protein